MKINQKVLTVVFSLEKGGTERAAQNFAFGYASVGCDSRVLFTRIDGPRRACIEARALPLYSLGSSDDCKAVRNWMPDVVHVHSHGINPDEFEKIKLLVPAAKYVETNVFSYPSPWADKIDISYQLSQWCLWLFKSRSSQKYPSALIPNAVDTSSFCRAPAAKRKKFRSQYGFSDTDIVLGRVGQSYHGKWSGILIDVFEELRQNDKSIKLLIVSPPDSILERCSNSRFLSDIVFIDKIIGDTNLSVCYSSIDVFVLIAEQGESFGMVLAESLLCETPAVTLSTPWGDNSQGEVIGHEIGGFVAAKKSYLVELVRKLVDDPLLRKKMGRDGRHRIIQNFDSTIVATKSLLTLSGENANFEALEPLALMRDSHGKIGVFSYIILKIGKGFFILAYTLFHRPAHHLPLQILRKLKSRSSMFCRKNSG